MRNVSVIVWKLHNFVLIIKKEEISQRTHLDSDLDIDPDYLRIIVDCFQITFLAHLSEPCLTRSCLGRGGRDPGTTSDDE